MKIDFRKMKIFIFKAARELAGILLVIVFISPFLRAGSFQGLSQEKDVLEKLKKGKIVARISKLILSDYNNFKYFMPNIKESFMVSPEGLEAFPEIRESQIEDWQGLEKKLLRFKQQEIKGDTFYFYNCLNLPWPLKDRYYILKMKRKPEEFTFSWTLYAGNTKVNEGSWQLLSFQGSKLKTLAVYRLLTNPGVSVSPGLIKIAMKITLPGTIKGLRKRALKLTLEERKNAQF